MTAYYNEFDSHAADWLEGLIADGLIAPGVVDRRSIIDVRADDLAGFTQVHFFAGIGGWSLAARTARWADDRPLWTGSCPCQPFSLAGKQRGFSDQRHLWPEFKRLIAERRPAVVFGEQVASASAWLGLVRSDLEALEYAVGCMPIEAASAGADHLRDRYWFVADNGGGRLTGSSRRESEQPGRTETFSAGDFDLAHHHHQGPQGRVILRKCADQWPVGADGVANADSGMRDWRGTSGSQRRTQYPNSGAVVNDASERRGEGRTESIVRRGRDAATGAGTSGSNVDSRGENSRRRDLGQMSCGSQSASGSEYGAVVPGGDGLAFDWVIGADGKARRVKRGIRLLAHGIRGRVVVGRSGREVSRVGVLKGFGNAIDPRPAAAFIGAYMDCCAA